MKRTPLTIQIGPLAYRVKETRGLRADDGTELLGQLRYTDQVIDLEAKQGLATKRVTLLHEIVHGILFNAGIRDHDEQLVDLIAHGVLDLLQRNPHLFPALGLSPTVEPV